MAFLYGIWGCFIAFAAAGLFRLLVVRRIKTELGASTDEWNLNFIELIKEHKARFPHSWTRTLSNALTVVIVLATGTGMALIVAAQFQPHSLYHLIPAGR
jgi:hypothetical protein